MRKYINPVLSLIFLVVTLGLSAETTSLKVKISNGTTGGIGKADSLQVILLQQAMLPLRELKNVEGSFTIQDLDLPEGVPVLLQATYKGANYNKMIPPVPEMRKKEIQMEVYDSTSQADSIQTRSLLQFVKIPKRLQVIKIYIVQNKTNPPQSYQSPNGLPVFIPEEAENLSGTWTQGSSQMGIPLSFEEGGEGIRNIRRSILPGNTEIQIQYTLPWEGESISVDDQILFEKSFGEASRPIFLRPQDMELQSSTDAKPVELKEDIPEGLRAYMVRYSKESLRTKFKLTGGTAIVPRFNQEPRQIVNGSWFPDWDTALVGVVGILALLFSLQYGMEYFYKKR